MSPLVKACLNCGREVFSVVRGTVTIRPPARVERVEANGNVIAICGCKRRVIWFKSRKSAQVSISAG